MRLVLTEWTSSRENLTLLHTNNKDADQPAHLISILVVAHCKV